MSARQWLGIAILAVCLAGPIAEAFDSWDQALPVGNDTEASVVVLALSLGLAISVAAVAVRWFQSFVSRPASDCRLVRPHPDRLITFARPCPTSSPPSPLRI